MSEHYVPPQTMECKVQHLGEGIQQVSPKMFMKKDDWQYVKWAEQEKAVQSIAVHQPDAQEAMTPTNYGRPG